MPLTPQEFTRVLTILHCTAPVSVIQQELLVCRYKPFEECFGDFKRLDLIFANQEQAERGARQRGMIDILCQQC